MRSADRNRDISTPLKSKQGMSTEVDVQALQSLIGSIEIDLTKSAAKDKKQLLSYEQRDQRSEVTSVLKHTQFMSLTIQIFTFQTGSQYSAGSGYKWKADASFDGDESFQSSQQDFHYLTGKSQQSSTNDTEDFTVIKFGTRCMLRGKLGKYLTATAEEVASSGTSGSTGSRVGAASLQQGPMSRVFSLGVEGQGVGESLDCVCFTNIDNK